MNDNNDIDSLCSVELPIAHEGVTPPTPRIVVEVPAQTNVQLSDSNTQTAGQHLQIPTFTFSTVDDAGSIHSWTSEDELVSGSRLEVREESKEPKSDYRPHSVLSFLQRPISALSRASSSLSARAKLALSRHSPHSFNFPPNKRVRSLVEKFVHSVRVRPEAQKEDDNISESSVSLADPDGSVHSHTIRKKLTESDFGDSGSENDDDRPSGLRRRFSLRYPRRRKGRMKCSCHYHIDPHGQFFLIWMSVMFVAFLYNAISIPLRASFEVQRGRGIAGWLLFDYIFDLVYILDILLVQAHLSYRSNGVLESNLKVLFYKYVKRRSFWFDVLSLLPLDILYAVPALRFNALLRLPRLLKFPCVRVFQDRVESWIRFPHFFRVAKLVSYFLYIIHIYACIYFAVSKREGFGINDWVYDGNGISYIRCFYWATLAVATIHELEGQNPQTTLEYVVELAGYLFGVFVIAVIIGEIRNIVEAANGSKLAAYRKWDRLKEYMIQWNTPKELQERVQSWYDYALTQQNNLDEGRALHSLPTKMKADLAIHVHLDTLCKVSLFKDCEKTLLRELVLKLRPVLFVPGDYICKKGEIGKEMYIVNKGQVQVVGGPESNEVLAELGPGSVFGEISLLAVGGGNRRTAHVRSKGFSSLFVLSKKDLHETLVDYPDAQETLKRKARYLLHRDKKREKKYSQQQQNNLATAKITSAVKVHRASNMAVTAFTTAARAARAQAAANKLEEEREDPLSPSQHHHHSQSPEPPLVNGAKCTTQVEVHVDNDQPSVIHVHPMESVKRDSRRDSEREKDLERDRDMAFVKVTPAARLKVIKQMEHVKHEASADPTSSSSTASGLDYISLWPSAKDVVIDEP